jgi:hypothetical protein
MIRQTLAAAFILTAVAAAAPQAGAAPTIGVRCGANEDRVWVYESLVDFNVQTKLKCGEQVEVIDRVKGYVKIRTTSGDEGFVNATAFPKSAIPPEPEDKSQDLQTVSQRALATARAHNAIAPATTPTVASTAAPAPATVTAQPTPAPAPTRVATPTPAPAVVTQPTVAATKPAPVVTAVATPAPAPAPVSQPAPPVVAAPAPKPAPAVVASAPAPQPAAVATVTPQPTPTPAAQPAPATTQPVVVAAATPAPAPAATKSAKSKSAAKSSPKPAPTATPAPATVAVSTPAPAPAVAATPAPQPGQFSIVDVTPTASNGAPAATTVAVAAHKANSDEDDEDNTPAVDASLANCSTYFVAYGLSPNQYKWIQQNRTKAFPSVCPAPTQAMVDYIVIFTHDVDFYNVTMPTAVHREQNGFSDWAPLSTVDDALMSRSDANKSHHEYVWVFHTHRGAYEPTSFSAHRKPIFSKDETNMLGSHGGFRTVMDALTYIESNPTGAH